MKQFILFFTLFFSVITCNAQRYEGITQTLSVRILKSYNQWSDWTKPVYTRTRIVIDADKSKVIIYSNTPQIYNILYAESHYYDNLRNECWEYKVIDQADDIGTLVVRYGKSWIQLYIRFADIQWVYYIE